MQEVLNTWQFNLVLNLICSVFFFQFYKLAVKNAKNDGAATIVLQIVAAVSILILFPFFPITFPVDWKVWFLLIAACIFYALNDRLQTTARKHLEVSVISILSQLTNVVMILYGLILFGEPLVFTKILGAAFILGGNIFLQYKNGSFHINTYVGYSIVASVALATALSIDVNTSRSFNLPLYIMCTFAIPAIFVWIAERQSATILMKEYNSKAQKFYIVTGLFWALTVFFLLRAYQLGPITTVVPLQATSVLLNVIVAYIFLNERSNGIKKIIVSLLVIAGIFLTVI